MVKIQIQYEGDLHCRLKHAPSGTEITTDAPKDNMGKGAVFSPTDLVAAALGSCMITTMAIFANRHSIDLKTVTADVTKEMTSTPPRRIERLSVHLNMPAGLSIQQRASLEHAALACPVHKSLHPDVEIPVQFHYPA